MQKNLGRVKKEMKTIDEKRYYEDLTVESLKDMQKKCETYYKEIEDFYSKVGTTTESTVRFNPEIAKYLYHVALRF